jgi:hypothetical protein
LVRFIAGDADPLARAACEDVFPAERTFFFVADPGGCLAEAPPPPAAAFFAFWVPRAVRPPCAVAALASNALRAGEARSDFA